MKPRKAQAHDKSPAARDADPVGVRIIGGKCRGRKIPYDGDMRTRPMKDRVREAVFNLVGPRVRGKQVIDLFAGTGALGLEALSRGAARATFVEQHIPTARSVERVLAELEFAGVAEVVTGSTFFWYRRARQWSPEPWLVFCSPPYDFYLQRTDDMLRMLESLLATAPLESLFVVEADERFSFPLLPEAARWDVRTYPPAVVGILCK